MRGSRHLANGPQQPILQASWPCTPSMGHELVAAMTSSLEFLSMLPGLKIPGMCIGVLLSVL